MLGFFFTLGKELKIKPAEKAVENGKHQTNRITRNIEFSGLIGSDASVRYQYRDAFGQANRFYNKSKVNLRNTIFEKQSPFKKYTENGAVNQGFCCH